jgi:hypothetical protein
MASFNHLNIQEASTVTAKAATVTMTRNSSVMHQELISLADPESSLSIARVSSAAPNSTDAGLIVRQVGHSTIVSVAAMPAGSTSVTIAAITGPVSTAAPATGDTGLIVRQVGYSTVVTVAALPANSSQVEVRNTVTIAGNSTAFMPAGQLSSAVAAANSSIAQVVRICGGPSSAADAAFTVHGNQSSNSSVYLPVRLTNGTGFLAAAADYVDGSTASSVAGPTVMFDNGSNVTMRPVSLTLGLPVNIVAGSAGGPTSTAAPATNDTGLVVRQVGYSTIVTVAALPANSSLVSLTQIAGGYLSTAAAAANSSALNVRIVGGPSSATDLQTRIAGPTSTTWASSAGFHFDGAGALNVAASFTGSTGPLTVTQLLTSSNEGVQVGDLANQALRVNVVAGAAGGSTIVSVAALPAGMISSAAPAATDTGLFVRQIGYSTVVSVAAMPADSSIVAVGSFAAGLISSAAPAAGSSGLVVWPVGYSTIVTVAALPANSSQVEVRAMPANSSVVALGSIAGGLLSTSYPAHGSSALLVRPVVSSLQSTTVTITSSNSTVVLTVLSSNAASQRIYAYFVGASTSGNHSTLLLGNSTNPTLWGIVMSSGVFGANMGVTPPGFLFETGAGNALTARLESASTAITARISLSFMVG